MHATLTYFPLRRENAHKPGPGSYDHNKNQALLKTPAKWKFGSETRAHISKKVDQMKKSTQDPGKYDPNYRTCRVKSQTWKFGSEKRPQLHPKHTENKPSPQAYEIPSKIIEGQKNSIHGRIELLQKNHFPGAGTYET